MPARKRFPKESYADYRSSLSDEDQLPKPPRWLRFSGQSIPLDMRHHLRSVKKSNRENESRARRLKYLSDLTAGSMHAISEEVPGIQDIDTDIDEFDMGSSVNKASHPLTVVSILVGMQMERYREAAIDRSTLETAFTAQRGREIPFEVTLEQAMIVQAAWSEVNA